MSKKERASKVVRTAARHARTGVIVAARHAKPFALRARHAFPLIAKRHQESFILLGAVLVSAAVVHSLLSSSRATSTPTGGVTISKSEMDPGNGKPAYDTILPTGTSIDQFGGWTRVSPVDRNPVFAYADVIKGKNINVSQQPIPDAFKPNIDEQVAHMARGYLANEKLTVGDTIVYIGTSAKGPQSVIFAQKDLLVLIKSSVKINSADWATYVGSLE